MFLSKHNFTMMIIMFNYSQLNNTPSENNLTEGEWSAQNATQSTGIF